MTAHSELALRAMAQNHDVESSASPSGQEVARRRYARKVVECMLEGETAGTDYSLSLCALPASEFPNGAKVVAIEFRSSAAVTESTTVYNTYTFSSVDADGINPLVSATMTTDTVANGGIGTTVAFKKYEATLSATQADRVIPAGGSLKCVRTHASTGTAVPKGSTFTVVLERL